MIQEGKNSMGLGGIGGGTQMLFGGSGGQDIFQKITWVLGAIFLFGSLTLALMKAKPSSSVYLKNKATTEQRRALPAPATEATEQTPQ